MFGYLRPALGELKVREMERFKACYCGLCRALGKEYGQASRFVLGYELVFLSMLLWDGNEALAVKSGRCPASPFRRRRYCAHNPAFSVCAGYNVILAWWKLRDSISDEPFVKSIPYRAASLFLRRAYRKASRDHAGFDATVRKSLSELAEYEKGAEATLDGAADKFAAILRSVADGVRLDDERRPLAEMLYHTGRWIYITDACDDYDGDIASKRYNPVAKRFPAEHGSLPDAGRERLETTLAHSNNLVCSAFELLPENIWAQVIRNTVYIGMPDVCRRVMDGSWPPKGSE